MHVYTNRDRKRTRKQGQAGREEEEEEEREDYEREKYEKQKTLRRARIFYAVKYSHITSPIILFSINGYYPSIRSVQVYHMYMQAYMSDARDILWCIIYVAYTH